MIAARMPNDSQRASLPLSTARTDFSVAEPPIVVLNSVFSKGGPNSQIVSVLETSHVPPSLHFVAPMRHNVVKASLRSHAPYLFRIAGKGNDLCDRLGPWTKM